MPVGLIRRSSVSITSPTESLKSPAFSEEQLFDVRSEANSEEDVHASAELSTQVYHKHTKEVRLVSPGIGALVSGAKFVGKQKNGNMMYDVKVELKHVNLAESTVSGYLNITGLTASCQDLTTFFDAEIIGEKYSFLTRKWDADSHVDSEHWSKFPAFDATMRERFNSDEFHYDFNNKECVFMRWKEHFLVPDHKIKTIAGASFAGFYYICLNTVTGVANGFYYHENSEWFQALDLTRVHDRTSQSFELR
jgi:glucose-induced degradation protein 4